MPPAVAKAPARRRNRKRKRRAASTSSSASSSSSESESESDGNPSTNTTTVPVKPIQEESSPESSSESSSSGSDSETEGDIPTVASGKLPLKSAQTHHVSPSPSPPPSKLPTFLPQTTTGDNDDIVQEQMMKDKFRKFWMASIADGFRDDLEEIRKEPNLGPSRLSLLIDSLASGADVFSSSRSEKSTINEIEVILE